MSENYSMRKIPVLQNDNSEIFDIEDNDKIKILELSNSIDEWEKELLFSDGGFFSLKGKQAEHKTEEFYKELEKFINLNISKIKLKDEASRTILSELKVSKLKAIKKQMMIYELSQLRNWEAEVCENGIKSCIQRAVLYKNNPEIIAVSHNNAITILNLMAKKEKWNSKTFRARKAKFESDFYFELINAFILEKDVRASLYAEKYKDKIIREDKENLISAIKNLKNNIVAYNWAKELFSYNLSESENEKEIKSIKDKDIQSLARNYFSEFKYEKKKNEKKEKQEKNENNWKDIVSAVASDLDKAELYIDYTLDEESIKSKRLYIKNIRKNGYICTDKNYFLSLLKMMFDDFEKFKEENISNSRKCLSAEDYQIIEKLRSYNNENYNFFVSDYRYVQNKLTEISVSDEDEIYDFVKFIFSAKENYVSLKKEEPDIEARNKLIKSALERYTNK